MPTGGCLLLLLWAMLAHYYAEDIHGMVVGPTHTTVFWGKEGQRGDLIDCGRGARGGGGQASGPDPCRTADGNIALLALALVRSSLPPCLPRRSRRLIIIVSRLGLELAGQQGHGAGDEVLGGEAGHGDLRTNRHAGKGGV